MLRAIGYVDDEAVGAIGSNCPHRLRQRLGATRAERHHGARLGKRQGEMPAKAARGPRNQNVLAVKINRFRHLPPQSTVSAAQLMQRQRLNFTGPPKACLPGAISHADFEYKLRPYNRFCPDRPKGGSGEARSRARVKSPGAASVPLGVGSSNLSGGAEPVICRTKLGTAFAAHWGDSCHSWSTVWRFGFRPKRILRTILRAWGKTSTLVRISSYSPDSIARSSRNRIAPSSPASEITKRTRPWLDVSA